MNLSVKKIIYMLLLLAWIMFKMNTMGNYQDIYWKTDDVFEKFINTCLEYSGLDPCHYFSRVVLD